MSMLKVSNGDCSHAFADDSGSLVSGSGARNFNYRNLLLRFCDFVCAITT